MAERGFDLIVIGGGPAGYVGAIRAAQLGMKVACVEKEAKLGGTCLRVGCIPSKALLDASEKFAQATGTGGSGAGLKEIGIQLEGVKLDLPTLMGRKDKVVAQLCGGVEFLFKKNKIERVLGTARLVKADTVEMTAADGAKRLLRVTPENRQGGVLIATGSVPAELPFMKFDGRRIISSDQAISLDRVPGRLVVIGAGAIGLELGSVWARLGTKVTVLEMFPQILAGGGGADEEMARALEKALKKQGLTFYTGAKVTGAAEVAGVTQVKFEWEGKTQSEPADVVLVAVGRRPYAEGLGLKELGVELDARGRIVVGGRYETNVPGVYAVGDVIAGPMLAHKAEEEAVACVELLAGKAGHVNYEVIPGVVYTAPELAWVGLTEAQCQERRARVGDAAGGVKIGRFKFSANGRALCMGEPEGLVKVIADAQTDRVLGVHILGPQASSLIGEAALAMEFSASSEDIARTCHAHPTLPEALKEAALAVEGRAIHA